MGSCLTFEVYQVLGLVLWFAYLLAYAGDLDFSSDKTFHSRLFSNILILQKQLASLKEQSTSSMLSIRTL